MYYTTNDAWIIAKSGAMGAEPDSLESIMAGHEAGASGFSIDVEMTGDSLPVLCENGHFILADGSKLIASEHSYFDIRQDFKKIVTIGQALELIKSYSAVVAINLHSTRPLAAIKSMLVHDEYNEKILITGFTIDKVAEYKADRKSVV